MDASDGVAALTRVEAIFRNPTLYELGKLTPRPPLTAGGAQRMFPDYMPIAYGALISVWGSARQVQNELAGPLVWEFIRGIVRGLFPNDPGMHLPGTPMRRHHYTYFRDQYLVQPQIFEHMRSLAREMAVSQARDAGLLNHDGAGSWTHPQPSRIMYGDGKVVTPLTKYKPEATHVDRTTGEVRNRRSEPDAALHYEGGDEEPVWGTKFVLAAVRGPDTHARFILDSAWVPKPGGEAEAAIDCFRNIAPLAPGAQGVAYDMAFRGKHNQELLQMGLIPIDNVAAKQKGVKLEKGGVIPRIPKDSHVEDVIATLRDGTQENCRIHVLDGEVGLGVQDDRGAVHFVKMKRRVRIDRKQNKKGGYRWYGTYELPDVFGGGGSVTIRLDQTGADDRRGFNRTENVRVIPHADDDFKPVFRLRKDAESINRGLEDSLYWNRAHSLGHLRQQVDILGYALMVNSLARQLAEHRAPPIAA
jgi:hypothetical protein